MILLRNAICFMPQLLLLLPPAEYNYSTAAPPSMQNDTITISRHHSNDPAVKLAICHALAQVGNGLPLCCAVLCCAVLCCGVCACQNAAYALAASWQPTNCMGAVGFSTALVLHVYATQLQARIICVGAAGDCEH